MADAEYEERSLARSASGPSAFPWQVSEVGHLPPDQSYLGRPVDPEIVKRVRGSLNKYKGPRTAEDKHNIIMGLAEERARKQLAASQEYFAWTEKVKAETIPSFKLPEDSRKGMPTSEQYVKKKVRQGLRDMREKTIDYKAWIEDLRVSQARKLHEKVAEKMKADENFNSDAVARDANRAARDAEIQAQVAEQNSQYWRWLKEMKDSVAQRPNSAPAATVSGAEGADSFKKKHQESAKALKVASAEYHEWLKTVSVAKFELPHHPVVSKEEQESRDLKLKVAKEDQKRTTSEYFEGVRQMEVKHHERIMRRLKEKTEKDAQFNAHQKSAAGALAAKLEAEQERQRQVEVKSRAELRTMYDRVRSKPLFLEMAYSK